MQMSPASRIGSVPPSAWINPQHRCGAQDSRKTQNVGRMGRFGFGLALGVFLMAAVTANASEWPQWLGPGRGGAVLSGETGLDFTVKPELVWTRDLARNAGDYSSPVVADGRVYAMAEYCKMHENEPVQLDKNR